ncbi:MAG: DUF1667 domain-containing protein [Oscillospiraceae bacterium]|jgi:CxxC motif-containing protein
MKETRELTCIGCPMGCALHVEMENGAVVSVAGNSCPHGQSYAEKECVSPERTLTSTVRVTGGRLRVAPVRTSGEIPKQLIPAAMKEIHAVRLSAPVRAGEIVVHDVAGSGVDIIATRSVEAA